MITIPEAPPRDDRALRIAIVASVVVHVILVLLALLANRGLQRILVPTALVHAHKPQDEIVTISSAIHFEKRARPVPAQPRRPSTRPHVSTPPRERALTSPPTVVVSQPTYAPIAHVRHELAKLAPHAPTQAATPAPHVSASAAAQPAFSQEKLAQIERDLAHTIAQDRANVDPIRTLPHEAPAAPKHYRVQMKGISSTLRRGEGTYSPIKAWHENGLDYYYVSYEFVYADGTYESGNVPWAIHFVPSVDPFTRDDPSLIGRTPLPAPPPEYSPPGTLGKALRSYFPKLRFSDTD